MFNKSSASTRTLQLNENKTKKTILAQAPTLSPQALKVSLIAYIYALKNQLTTSSIISLIDYSLPSTKKRLWVINLSTSKILFHTYVAHGKSTGLILAKKFSNKNNSHKTSIGFYLTQSPYMGKHGLSLHLQGLDPGFNSHALKRHIVIHSAPYATARFIKQYGYLGRSWGCPAIPPKMLKPIINIIKNKTLLIAYYPNQRWINASTLLKNDKKPYKNIAA
ncbi:hypothetical protein PsalN5692_02221 [Piscirickettsia salmonis]|nr:murein L,D-transpeptidase catalytic domain family protein [Piscirickettsia salmonis]QGP50750.1 hypothetical protein PsalN5692_02221 [Piscirickettsia salmonis]